MKCPQCGKELQIPNNTQMNIDNYVSPTLTITKCCGKLVKLYPHITFNAVKYEGEEDEDDWGRKPIVE